MDRRHFLQHALAFSALPALYAQPAANSTASLSIGSATTRVVPHDFAGLSYETAQLANPDFFSAGNHSLVKLFRELSPAGNLRLGGGSSEYATFSESTPSAAPPFEVFGPDTSHTVKEGTITSALSLRRLRTFLDAVNWSCLYGLNLGRGTIENAVMEAQAVHTILGPRLLALQIGNEPDSFRRRYRPESYGPADYLKEWLAFHDAIAAAVPGARFAGPDISNKLPYLSAFAQMAPQHRDIVLLTGHYYAMGPASNPAATLDNLLDPDPKLTTLKRRDLHVITEACEEAHLPFRISEGNSCWDGGKAGVSDTYASALWCADYMMACMSRGWAGVNLHGGGNGLYTPIAGAPSSGFIRRPEFFGIQFAQRFAGASSVDLTLSGASPRVVAYGFQHGSIRDIAIVNKTAEEFTATLAEGLRASLQRLLSAPAIDAKDNVRLTNENGRASAQIHVPAYSAAVFRVQA